ncbi:MAG: hypothetical protein M1827_006316 [Pycnora praestabilis]|nr:MAG: hypothetical protein M1827_006316 [Pycnora praestabilis]
MVVSSHEQRLCRFLRDQPRTHQYRYTSAASRGLLETLFRSLTANNDEYLRLLFPQGTPESETQEWKLREAQGAVEGAEYTAAARGKPCGHIFKSGEATYRCRTCSIDDTCVLCSRCFESSDHTEHQLSVSVSPGNSGCCDCGDLEAWRVPVNCAIHTAPKESFPSMGEGAQILRLPADLVESIGMTIGRAIDYMCDVISCSPEQLRLPKTEETIKADEETSRLNSKWYEGGYSVDAEPEFSLVLWNDEKHTVLEVENQVARACKQTTKFGLDKANETNDMGRSIIEYSSDLKKLLKIAKIIEEIKVTVTVRSSRDTFREQMCGTIIEWLVDIAGCSVGVDHNILRQIICEQMLKLWRAGSEASNAQIGRRGIDDHEKDDGSPQERRLEIVHALHTQIVHVVVDNEDAEDNDDLDGDDNDDDGDDDDDDGEGDDDDEMDIDLEMPEADADGDLEMENVDEPEDDTEVSEATYAGYPPPPPPPPPHPRRRGQNMTPTESDAGDPLIPSDVFARGNLEIPKTPSNRTRTIHSKPPRYWLEKPAGYSASIRESLPVHEDLWQRVRLDWMILFDLRMWKKARIDLRELYITTVVAIPEFKRILGLRFAGLYTTLAQLYLIADREPDHSIINLSLQMLTTPSITDEVVERGNFLTSLIAILYTFLTTRQVGHPHDISPNATLAFDAGSVTNRRMYHFFMDLKYLFGSEHVQQQLRTEERYVQQFLDLVKLHQGICPNVRAVGEHVEYETDAWISASLITREVNRLCRQFAESFRWRRGEDDTSITKAIRIAARAAFLNSLGAERKRFDQAEIKEETKFKIVGAYELDRDEMGDTRQYRVVDFVVEKQPISFHHALHYTLSWLIDCSKSMSRDQLLGILHSTAQGIKELHSSRYLGFAEYDQEDFLLAMYDFPLRVCAWLAQMKAGMWVRNGLSLRHQMSTYRGVGQRDVAHHRDMFLLQSALVTCNPSRVLASMIDRFGMNEWIKGNYIVRDGYEDIQMVDVAEDLIHLMIILLCDRIALLPYEDEPNPQILAIRRDIAHVLCLKALSYSDISARLADKLQDLEEFQGILDDMTTFRFPENLNDSGLFELKDEFLEDIDPYTAHYSKNHREEAETAYRTRMAKRLGKPASEIVFEPRIREISTGVFVELATFTRTPLFSQVIYSALAYALQGRASTPNIPATRIETFLQVVLHLVLITIAEDRSDEDEMLEEPRESFVKLALSRTVKTRAAPEQQSSIVDVLHKLSITEELKACHPKIHLVLRRLQQKRPQTYHHAVVSATSEPSDAMSTGSPSAAATEDPILRKKQALERQRKVMAQFQEQQKNFIDNQGNIDWGEDDSSDAESGMDTPTEDHGRLWKYPTGTCILCQEETNDARVYGTFALMMDSNILRQTDLKDPDFVAEAANAPSSLDRSADHIRPCGVSGQNKELVRKMTSKGEAILAERQGLGKGFPSSQVRRGPVTTGCGHIMHYSCFDDYFTQTQKRQALQIARKHPENVALKEFVCPLCKALGNVFLPIIWKGKEELYPGVLQPQVHFEEWLGSRIGPTVSRQEKGAEGDGQEKQATRQYLEVFANYTSKFMISLLATKLEYLMKPCYPGPVPPMSQSNRHQMPGFYPIDESRFPSAQDPLTMHSLGQLREETPPPVLELLHIFRRLRDTMSLNKFSTRYTYPLTTPGVLQDLTYTDTLAETLGLSISSVEITQRGVGSKPGSTLLDKIPQQSLTHLRILSETVSSYVAVGGLRNTGTNRTVTEFTDTHSRQLHQLFIGHPQIRDPNAFPLELKQLDPLLGRDCFVFFTECSLCLVPALRLDVHHILRLCYMAEIVKVVFACINEPSLVHVAEPEVYTKSMMTDGFEAHTASRKQMQLFQAFFDRVAHIFDDAIQSVSGESLASSFKTLPGTQNLVRSLAASYALPFLRKSVILLHVHFGVDFPITGTSDVDEPELDRLTRVLGLDSLDDIFKDLSGDGESTSILCSVVAGWIRHLVWAREGKRPSKQARASLSLSHPAIFELVGLPKNFDTLSEETMKRRCPTTGKELVDPSICLFCGDIFCSQAWCCMRVSGKVGGCNQHIEKCGHNIGLFINIRKCTILYLHNKNGSWGMAPYLDKHGEVDPGLRRTRQLFLNQRRYDLLLRNVWLNHGVPSTISRKLEAEINNGGWETI